MDADWVNSAAGRRILVHWADPRPAWLWTGDGNRLLWRNGAARFFNAKLKKSGLKLSPDPVPIKGQVARLIRLGATGRSSLSRIQFLAGQKPVSTTCTVTPLELPNGEPAVLIVAVDAVEHEFLTHLDEPTPDSLLTALLPPSTEHILVAPDGHVVGGSPGGMARFAETIESQGLPDDDRAEMEMGDGLVHFTRLTASRVGHQLLLIAGSGDPSADAIADLRAEDGLDAQDDDTPPEASAPDEPLLPMGLPPVPEAPVAPAGEEAWGPPLVAPASQSLSSLFDRLAEHDELYGELSAADEHYLPPPERIHDGHVAHDEPPPVDGSTSEPPLGDPDEPEIAFTEVGDEEPGHDVIAAVIAFEDDLHEDRAAGYQITGRGFTPLADAPVEPPPAETHTAEGMDSDSRRNFSELGRILADRVGNGNPPTDDPVVIDTPIEPIRPPSPPPASEGALINIAGETFILNRLPLGIMVFRDQQVLFANRALADLVGYETIDSLRAGGMSAIFPSDDTATAGPVTHLVRSDGTRFPVTARLQSITWQGRPALMLSAAAAEQRLSHEAAVRTFAEVLAAAWDDGFIAADRSGRVTALSPIARGLLGRSEAEATDVTLAALVRDGDVPALRSFLEQPARFAETSRPSVLLRGTREGTELVLFAEGQAGIVTGYFGLVRLAAPAPAVPDGGDDDVDPTMLARVSRGVRRPLNTIIGFSDLIRSAAFGAIENHRYLEYARDIRTAGQEIAVLVDELDDFTRLRAGSYPTRPADLDLSALLESCMVRVRGQAAAARVLVRSAISERLPRIHADRASMGQAILNLLASAIDQTPPGATVILSAQPEDDGAVTVNVRDGGPPGADPGDRFVVFRDGVGKDGEPLAPVRSSVGLALTRSLIAVNGCTLSVGPAGAVGTLFSIVIPPDLVATAQSA